ncbi:MFS transporter [Paenibacillus thailandensis]|uniref:MFS transporter n=1 Tax=Paenibacillus thailandensis TaxID=393250 RepID=A0ABW5R1N7_9BACL
MMDLNEVSGTKVFLGIMSVLATGAVLVVSLLYMTIPLLPVLSDAFDAPAIKAVWAGSAFGFAYALGNLVFGTWSDRTRRRNVLAGGLFALVLSSIAVAFSPTLEWLIALRAVQGFFAASFPPAALAYVGDVFAPRLRPVAISTISCGFLLAGVLGQIYASEMEPMIGWRGAFGLSAAGFLVLALCALRLPPGTAPNVKIPVRTAVARLFGLLGSAPLLFAYAVAVTLLLCFVAMYAGLGSHIEETFGIGERGLMWIRLAGIPGILVSPLAGRSIERFGASKVLIAGLLIAAAGIVSEGMSTALLPLVVSSVAFVAGIATAVPGVIVLVNLFGGRARGSAAALYGCFIFAGASIGPLLSSALMQHQHGFRLLGIALAAILCLAALMAWGGSRFVPSASAAETPSPH